MVPDQPSERDDACHESSPLGREHEIQPLHWSARLKVQTGMAFDCPAVDFAIGVDDQHGLRRILLKVAHAEIKRIPLAMTLAVKALQYHHASLGVSLPL